MLLCTLHYDMVLKQDGLALVAWNELANMRLGDRCKVGRIAKLLQLKEYLGGGGVAGGNVK